MLLQLIVIRDSGAGSFSQPQASVSVGSATRGFSDEVNRADDKNPLYKHSEDFELYHLGSFDDFDASFDLFEKPQLIVRGKDVRK